MLSRGFKAGMQFPVYILAKAYQLNIDKLQHHVMLPLFDTGSSLRMCACFVFGVFVHLCVCVYVWRGMCLPALTHV